MSIEKSELGDVVVTSTGDRVVIDETKVKLVPDGSHRLDWTGPQAQDTAAEFAARKEVAQKLPNTTSTANDERLPMDTPEYAEKFVGKGITPEFIKITPYDGHRTVVETIRPAAWDATDPLEIEASRQYGEALRAREAGLAFDADCIALHQSGEWRDPSFRATYFERVRKIRKNGAAALASRPTLPSTGLKEVIERSVLRTVRKADADSLNQG